MYLHPSPNFDVFHLVEADDEVIFLAGGFSLFAEQRGSLEIGGNVRHFSLYFEDAVDHRHVDEDLADFAAAGADIITVHIETCPHIHRTIQEIHNLGVKAGVTLNPGTPLMAIDEILGEVELVLIMSVNPGFGGQSYIPTSTGKIARLRRMLDGIGSTADLEVDGGVKVHNIAEVAQAGANVIVAGSAVFGGEKTIAENMSNLRSALLQ